METLQGFPQEILGQTKPELKFKPTDCDRVSFWYTVNFALDCTALAVVGIVAALLLLMG